MVLRRAELAVRVDRAATVERARVHRRELTGPQPAGVELQPALVDHLDERRDG